MFLTDELNKTPLWVSVIAAIAILAILIGVFIWTFLANKKTPKPEGCEVDIDKCSSCDAVNCGYHIQEISKEIQVAHEHEEDEK